MALEYIECVTGKTLELRLERGEYRVEFGQTTGAVPFTIDTQIIKNIVECSTTGVRAILQRNVASNYGTNLPLDGLTKFTPTSVGLLGTEVMWITVKKVEEL